MKTRNRSIQEFEQYSHKLTDKAVTDFAAEKYRQGK